MSTALYLDVQHREYSTMNLLADTSHLSRWNGFSKAKKGSDVTFVTISFLSVSMPFIRARTLLARQLYSINVGVLFCFKNLHKPFSLT